MKRGLASPWVHSALPITRRSQSQRSSVRHVKSRNRRAGFPVAVLSGLGGREFGPDPGDQARVAGEAEDVINPVGFVPDHQGIAAEAGIRAEQNPHARPATADLTDDPCDLLDGTCGCVDVRSPQLGRQQVPAAEDVERQMAEAVVIAVEEPSFLMAGQRIVGSIEVERDLCRWLAMGVEEKINEQRLDGFRIVTDPVIPRGVRTAQLQPVQR